MRREAGGVPDIWDDEGLLAVLKEALQAERAVPPEFAAAGRSAYAWHNIDAELAELTYDSLDPASVATVRSETASIRALTFTSDHLTIEMEVNEDSLLCQLVPTGEGTIEVQTRAGVVATIVVDEIGCFPISPIPATPFRLSCRTARGENVVTGWIALLHIPERPGRILGRYSRKTPHRCITAGDRCSINQGPSRPAATAWPDRGCPEPSA